MYLCTVMCVSVWPFRVQILKHTGTCTNTLYTKRPVFVHVPVCFSICTRNGRYLYTFLCVSVSVHETAGICTRSCVFQYLYTFMCVSVSVHVYVCFSICTRFCVFSICTRLCVFQYLYTFMCVSVSVHVYVCFSICTRLCVFQYLYTFMCVSVSVHVYVCFSICTRYVCFSICTRLCVFQYLYTFMCVSVSVHVSVCFSRPVRPHGARDRSGDRRGGRERQSGVFRPGQPKTTGPLEEKGEPNLTHAGGKWIHLCMSSWRLVLRIVNVARL